MSTEIEENQWVICTNLGGRSYLKNFANQGKSSVAVWCANLDKARIFTSVGELAQYFAAIPHCFQAYEEDLRSLRYNIPNFEGDRDE